MSRRRASTVPAARSPRPAASRAAAGRRPGGAAVPPPPARRGPRPAHAPQDTRSAVFAAAADAFSGRGFDGVRVDEIAGRAGVNKAMLYYHFGDKLALYRAVVADMLHDVGGRVLAIGEGAGEPEAKLAAIVDTFITAAGDRPWFPTLMLREVSDGAPHPAAWRPRTPDAGDLHRLSRGCSPTAGEPAVFRRDAPGLARFTSASSGLCMFNARQRR